MLKKSYGEDDMGKYMPELDIMPEPDIIGKSETDIMNRRNEDATGTLDIIV